MTHIDGLVTGSDGIPRCWWSGNDALYQQYHDYEWGRPVHEDRRLFEKICLEGFQAGLSWLTILRKRENFRAAFDQFDFGKVASYGAADIERLVQDAGIVRHRGKIESVINNARRALVMQQEFGTLDAYFWSWAPDKADRPSSFDYETLRKIATSAAATALSKDLKKRGWSFVGPTTVYAFMQAMGMVNDHVEGCHCRAQMKNAK